MRAAEEKQASLDDLRRQLEEAERSLSTTDSNNNIKDMLLAERERSVRKLQEQVSEHERALAERERQLAAMRSDLESREDAARLLEVKVSFRARSTRVDSLSVIAISFVTLQDAKDVMSLLGCGELRLFDNKRWSS